MLRGIEVLTILTLAVACRSPPDLVVVPVALPQRIEVASRTDCHVTVRIGPWSPADSGCKIALEGSYSEPTVHAANETGLIPAEHLLRCDADEFVCKRRLVCRCPKLSRAEATTHH